MILIINTNYLAAAHSMKVPTLFVVVLEVTCCVVTKLGVFPFVGSVYSNVYIKKISLYTC